MLNVWDWELLGSQSETRMQDWYNQCAFKYQQVYGIELDEAGLKKRHAEILKNPLFCCMVWVQSFWMRLTWIVKHRLFYRE
jgi:hypothetical protein